MTAAKPAPVDNVVRARAAWGPKAPDWVLVLAEQCNAAGSQRTVGQALGYGASVINQVIGNAYRGALEKVEQKVRGRFMNLRVTCPVLGEISVADCLDHQARPFAPTNPQRVRLHRACRTCPNRRK